jgi:uncharacterized oligopeptide transporter (OPT) family protein
MKAILRTAACGLAIASFGIASSASAATNDEAQVTATILTALSVDVVPGDDTLNFGTIADGGIVAATNITVDTAGARVGACPALLQCGVGGYNAPTFEITGLTGLPVNITVRNATESLNLPVGTVVPAGFASAMTVSAFTRSTNQITLSATPANNRFSVGGTLTVNPNQ